MERMWLSVSAKKYPKSPPAHTERSRVPPAQEGSMGLWESTAQWAHSECWIVWVSGRLPRGSCSWIGRKCPDRRWLIISSLTLKPTNSISQASEWPSHWNTAPFIRFIHQVFSWQLFYGKVCPRWDKGKDYRSFESKAEKDSHIGDQFKTLRSRSECKKK